VIPLAAPFEQYRAHGDAVRAAILRVLESGEYILGGEVAAFERAFAAYCGGGHAVGVGSGTDALVLALKALGIGPGDEVITVSHTAVATVAAILAAGATPALIDVEETYMTLDPNAIDAAVTSRPRCLVPAFDGVLFSFEWKDALWDKFFTAAPRRQRRSVEQYKIVKRA
jgi:dTDP-4-amino-4,6-dideoxygalactose transaminase